MIIAHYKEKIKELLVATGNVEVHYKEIKLLADRIEINTETKDVYAEGNVVIQMPNEVMSAESIHFNLDSSQGELKKVFGMVQPTVFYEAETLERKDVNLYSFQKAKITSCTQPIPRWSFSCSRADFKKDDYIKMWNTVFSIKKIPIFYFPYLRYPLNRERATGFLMPQLGYSGVKGLVYSQSFYWALKRNMDATFNFDYFSNKGIGAGLQYRYLFSAGTGGNLNFYYFRYKQIPDQPAPAASAYLLRLSHNQPLPFKFSLVASVNHQSSFNFLREFDNDFKRALIFNRSSQVYLSRAWSYFNFNARVSRFETYFSQIDNSVIRYTLPEIRLSSSQIKMFGPLYFRFNSLFNSWQYGWNKQYLNNNQLRSQTLAVSPTFSLPFTTIPWFTLNSSFSANFNYHFKTYAPNSRVVVDEPLLARNYTLNVELVGPVFNRIFYGSQGLPKVKHIIEPSFTYHYESPIDSSDRLIIAGRYYRYHYIKYGLTNRILVKQRGMPREIITLGLSQTFYLAPEDSPLSRYPVNGEIHKFSNVAGYIRFYPSRKYTIDLSASFNPYNKNFSSLRVAANMGSMQDPISLRVNWYRSINPYYSSILSNRHQISFFGQVRIPQLALRAQAAVDYNILQKELLYSAFVLVYQYQCLELKASCRIFYFRESPDVQFRISFGLGNIGKTTDFLGGMEF
ncbi:MAG: LPS-assembly protein LptD [Candidatus Aminicenantales bacterium]